MLHKNDRIKLKCLKGKFSYTAKIRLYFLSIYYANDELTVVFYGYSQLMGQKKESTRKPVETY